MTDPLYIRCPDCNGMGSVSVMDGQGRETELQCERCANEGGYVPVDEVRLSRAEWEATIDRCEHGVLLMKGTGHQIDGNLWCRAAVGAECFGGDPACPCQDGDLCHYRGDNASPPIHTTSELPDHQRPGVAVGEEREVYVTTCKNHSGGPASPHVLECFKELAAVGEETP